MFTVSNKYLTLILISCILSQGCYTILLKPTPYTRQLTTDEHERKNFDLLEFDLNQNIIGYWSNTRMWMDYGDVVRRLEFDNTGRIVFIPNYEVPNSKYEIGEFRTMSDTLIIRFINSYYLEKFIFKISDNTLHIRTLDEPKYEYYSVTRNSSTAWKRELR